MTAYYAHPVSIYNAPQEARDLAIISALGFEVVNPNSKESDAGYKQHGMAFFNGLIQGCNLLIFRAFPDGSIPAGVAAEISSAQSIGLFVIELPSAILRRGLNVDETREALKQCGAR